MKGKASADDNLTKDTEDVDLKKSYKADLEHKRKQAFLLGLVFVLALFVVSLEYTISGGTQDDRTDMLDDMAQEVELMPAVQQKDMVAAAPAARSQSLAAKINIVDKPENTAETEQPINETGGVSDQNGTGGTGTGIATTGNESQNTSAISPVAVDENDNPLNFQVVERLPEFPGGIVEFMKWLTKNLRYPVPARQQKIEGKVVVSFIINKDGTVTAQKVIKSVSPELDCEALRVLRMMPKWKPGEDHGKPCRTYFSIPINFKL